MEQHDENGMVFYYSTVGKELPRSFNSYEAVMIRTYQQDLEKLKTMYMQIADELQDVKKKLIWFREQYAELYDISIELAMQDYRDCNG